VAGVGGYAGGELARLLLRHPLLRDASPLFLGRAEESDRHTPLDEIHPHLASGDWESAKVYPFSWSRLENAGTEILFLATPHETSREWVPEAMARGIRVIDLSGAWRLKEEENRAVYKLHDENPDEAAALQHEAVYGCPELHCDEIRTARLVANPGCYATSIILALAPLKRAGVIDVGQQIICDAKSGVSGAGKAPTARTHFMYAADNLSVYSVFGHRHMGELLEQLDLTSEEIQFTPHLLPIPRGILSTVYVQMKEPMKRDDVQAIFAEFYSGSPMVRMTRPPLLPEIQHVVRTNFCDLGFAQSPRGKRLVVVSCLDNLLKGAAGQAVQNMNLMCGWKEEEGLI
jgi:N-acetyl-gamma-glutamyl-phosphate reductase